MEKDFAYFCDRKKCPVCTYPSCRHTTDINHAINFKKDKSGRFVEFRALELPEVENSKQNDFWKNLLRTEVLLVRTFATSILILSSDPAAKKIATIMSEHAEDILNILDEEKE